MQNLRHGITSQDQAERTRQIKGKVNNRNTVGERGEVTRLLSSTDEPARGRESGPLQRQRARGDRIGRGPGKQFYRSQSDDADFNGTRRKRTTREHEKKGTGVQKQGNIDWHDKDTTKLMMEEEMKSGEGSKGKTCGRKGKIRKLL